MVEGLSSGVDNLGIEFPSPGMDPGFCKGGGGTFRIVVDHQVVEDIRSRLTTCRATMLFMSKRWNLCYIFIYIKYIF